MERPDEVLAFGQVDGGLASDRGIDLSHERGGHGYPCTPSEKCGSGEPGGVREGPAPQRQDRVLSLNPQRAPKSFHFLHGLGPLTRRQLVRLDEPRAERELGIGSVDARDVRLRDERDALAREELAEAFQRAGLDVHPCGREHDSVHVLGARVGYLGVERCAQLVAAMKLGFVLSVGPVTVTHALPGLIDVDGDEGDELVP